MPPINIRDDFYKELVLKDINPTQFVNRLLDQHFYPWKYIKYENDLIDRQIAHLTPTESDLIIIHKYLAYEILREFKRRMYQRYEHSVPLNSLEYLMKSLSLIVVDYKFNQDEIEKNYGEFLDKIKAKDPNFNLRTYIDNILRIKFLPNQYRNAIGMLDKLMGDDPDIKKYKSNKKKQERKRRSKQHDTQGL